jgi:hypothetical protein
VSISLPTIDKSGTHGPEVRQQPELAEDLEKRGQEERRTPYIEALILKLGNIPAGIR